MPHITSSFADGTYQINLKTDTGNTLISDEPLSVGGNDLGFTPQELLASSLAACTGATLRMYAVHKGWDLKDAAISVNLKWDPETNSSVIDRTINFVGDLDEKQLERLSRIADSCPVHKILSHQINIATTTTHN